MANVEEIIHKLKMRFGVKTDSELASKLRLGRSTISSWKARGSIPQRFERASEGYPWDMASNSPLSWSYLEQQAFEIAMLRFMNDYDEVRCDFGKYINSEIRAWSDIWTYHSDAMKDLYASIEAHPDESEHSIVDMFIYNEFFSDKG